MTEGITANWISMETARIALNLHANLHASIGPPWRVDYQYHTDGMIMVRLNGVLDFDIPEVVLHGAMQAARECIYEVVLATLYPYGL